MLQAPQRRGASTERSRSVLRMADLDSRNGSKSRQHAAHDTAKEQAWRLPLAESGLAQAIVSAAQKLKEAQVSKNLKLLADFVPDVAIGRMKSSKAPFKGINL